MKKVTSALLLLASCAGTARAATPSGNWTLRDYAGYAKDYALRIDVDPGEAYLTENPSPSSVFWPEFINFIEPAEYKKSRYGYLGLMRGNGMKFAIVTVWGGLDALGDTLHTSKCFDENPCVSIKGHYDWKVGHNYRFRMQKNASLTSDTAGEWWQFTLADLTMGTVSVLGSLKLPYWGGISPSNQALQTYIDGPFNCASVRHARVTMGQIRANYNGSNILKSSNASTTGEPDLCATENILPGMSVKDYGTTASDDGGTFTFTGNNFRGLHQWGQYESKARKDMMFVRDLTEAEPYIFEARHDGEYGPFPADGDDNDDWKSIGVGYPIINDLRLRHQRVREWGERNNPDVRIGDYFIYHNTYNGDTEYFQLKMKRGSTFPIDKTDDAFWRYVGRYPKKTDKLWSFLPVHERDPAHPTGKKGWLYENALGTLYLLRQDGEYGEFPYLLEDNKWWEFVSFSP